MTAIPKIQTGANTMARLINAGFISHAPVSFARGRAVVRGVHVLLELRTAHQVLASNHTRLVGLGANKVFSVANSGFILQLRNVL
jgi:hypothetical protein